MYIYSAYQLVISSELSLPELCSIDDSIGESQPHISIVFGQARRESAPNADIQSLYYQIQPEACWIEVPNVTCFLIEYGRKIIIEPFPGADEDSLRLFLYTICLPLVLIYHDYFLLHGGAIHAGEESISFLTHFGQGKSTLLASLLKYRHFRFISDDICVLNHKGLILPGFPALQLRKDAIIKLDIDQTSIKLIRPTLQKWYIPIQQAFYSASSMLKIIYIINPTNRADVLMAPLVGLRKIQYLKKYTYHPLMVKGLGKDQFYFQQCAILAARTAVTYVERPKQGFRWDEFTHLIEQDFQTKVLECQ